MNFLSIGAGAVGGYVAGSLALAGHEVTFLLRPGSTALIREDGLHLKLSELEQHVLPAAVADTAPAALAMGPFDAAILAVKAYDVSKALEPFENQKQQLPPFICIQNGIGSEDLAAARIGVERVIPASLTTAVSRAAGGEITLERRRGLAIADTHPAAAALVTAMENTDLNPRLYADTAAMKWSKLLTNLLANASSAILDMSPDEIFSRADTYWMEILQLREALAVMAALEVPVVDLPGTPVKALAFAAQRLPAWISRPLLRRAVGRGRGQKMPSFHIDLHGGRRESEVPYLNGAVSAYGGRLGIPTPVNTVFAETLLGLMAGEEPLANFAKKPEQLVGRLRPSS